MKASELIKKLSELPDLDVLVSGYEDGATAITDVKIILVRNRNNDSSWWNGEFEELSTYDLEHDGKSGSYEVIRIIGNRH